MRAKEKVLQYIEENKDEIVRVACNLIRIPSVSGREDSNEQYHRMADYLTAEFDRFGIPAARHAMGKGGCNLVAGTEGNGKGKTFAMGGHYDVVAADEPDWATNGFVPVIRDGKLIGRGAADMKAAWPHASRR